MDSGTITALNRDAPVGYEAALASANRHPPVFPTATAATAAATAAKAPEDSAVISIAAQAKLLEDQGLNFAEIAERLGVTTSAVQGDLAIALISAQAKAATVSEATYRFS
jgi:hypothetical protein